MTCVHVTLTTGCLCLFCDSLRYVLWYFVVLRTSGNGLCSRHQCEGVDEGLCVVVRRSSVSLCIADAKSCELDPCCLCLLVVLFVMFIMFVCMRKCFGILLFCEPVDRFVFPVSVRECGRRSVCRCASQKPSEVGRRHVRV